MIKPMDSLGDLCDSLFADRHHSIRLLEHFAAELPDGRSQQVTERLAADLGSCSSPDEIRNSPMLLGWLPCLLAVDRSSDDDSAFTNRIESRIARLAMANHGETLARRMWIYPSALLIGMACLLAMYCLVVIPRVRDFFYELHLEVPRSTRFLFRLSEIAELFPWWAFVLVLALLVAVWLVAVFKPSLMLGWNCSFDQRIVSWMRKQSPLRSDLWHDLADLVDAGAEPGFALRYLLQRSTDEFEATSSIDTEINHVKMVRMPPSFFNCVGISDAKTLAVSEVDTNGLRAWAAIYQARQLRQASPRWLAVATLGMNVAAVLMVSFLVKAIYGPLVQLIQGLT